MSASFPLGRQHEEALRERLNRTLSPQGVEVVTVIIRATELPPAIAEQMAGRTLHVSLAAEQRALKRLETQRVRQEHEAQGLRQRCEIERALEVKEAERKAQQVRDHPPPW